MHKKESRVILNRKCISKQYWLAMNGNPKNVKKKKIIPERRFEIASPGRERHGCLR